MKDKVSIPLMEICLIDAERSLKDALSIAKKDKEKRLIMRLIRCIRYLQETYGVYDYDSQKESRRKRSWKPKRKNTE